MPKNNHIKLQVFHLPLFILGVMFVGALTYTAIADASSPTVLGVKDKQPKAQGNVSKAAKPVTASKIKDSVTSSGNQHKVVISEVVDTLSDVADTEKRVGNKKVSDEVSDVADTTEEIASETVEAIDAIESKPAWKVALLGPDYKNLGQLRSSLAKNTNEIRKLTQTMEKATVQNRVQIQAQIETLNQERLAISEIVSTNESKFSLLGWVSRLLTGYTTDPENIGGIEVDITEPSTEIETETPETTAEPTM